MGVVVLIIHGVFILPQCAPPCRYQPMNRHVYTFPAGTYVCKWRCDLLLMLLPTVVPTAAAATTQSSSVDKASFSFQFPPIGHESPRLDGYFLIVHES